LGLAAIAPSTREVSSPLLSLARTAYAAAPLAPAEVVLAFESQMLDLVNADRVANGLASLEFDPMLATVARWRSEDMATADYFGHDIGNVPGRRVFEVLRSKGVTYRAAGENLARLYIDTVESATVAEAALMNSPTHRANILQSGFTHLGVGVAVAHDGRVVYTQLFKTAW